MGEKLWVRCGEQDDYHPFDSVQEAANYIASCEEIGGFTRCNEYGIEGAHYKGFNYISIFWGDKEAQPIRQLEDLNELGILVEDRYNRTHP